MDTSKFELTKQEILDLFSDGETVYWGAVNKILKNQVAKVFSMLEPVELEVLGYAISQATIQYNQKKYGKLFRLKELKSE